MQSRKSEAEIVLFKVAACDLEEVGAHSVEVDVGEVERSLKQHQGSYYLLEESKNVSNLCQLRLCFQKVKLHCRRMRQLRARSDEESARLEIDFMQICKVVLLLVQIATVRNSYAGVMNAFNSSIFNCMKLKISIKNQLKWKKLLSHFSHPSLNQSKLIISHHFFLHQRVKQ